MTVIGGYREGRCCTLPLQLAAGATSERRFKRGPGFTTRRRCHFPSSPVICQGALGECPVRGDGVTSAVALCGRRERCVPSGAGCVVSVRAAVLAARVARRGLIVVYSLVCIRLATPGDIRVTSCTSPAFT